MKKSFNVSKKASKHQDQNPFITILLTFATADLIDIHLTAMHEVSAFKSAHNMKRKPAPLF